jgi:hypothetical protein
MQDIYRLRKIVKQEEVARSMSSDGDQSDYEHSECSPKIEEDEEPTIKPEDISETGPATEVDEDLDLLDEQSDGYAEPGIFTSPPPGSAVPHPGMEFAASPAVPAVSTETTVPPASSMAPAISPVVRAASMESTALSVVPQVTHYSSTPPPPAVPPPHNTPGSWFMPPPVVVHISDPPYQMTLYPLYPVYLPPPTH